MKNFLFFLLIGGLVSLASCSKNSDELTEKDLLIGKWKITSLVDLDGDQMVENSDGYRTEASIEFTADGKAELILKYVETASGTSEIEKTAGNYVWQNATSLRIDLADGDESAVLVGTPEVSEKSLRVDFSATTPDGDGVLKMMAER